MLFSDVSPDDDLDYIIEFIDKLPSIIEVSVVTRRGVEATVMAIPSWRERMCLKVELTEGSMDLLNEDPLDVTVAFTPRIKCGLD